MKKKTRAAELFVFVKNKTAVATGTIRTLSHIITLGISLQKVRKIKNEMNKKLILRIRKLLELRSVNILPKLSIFFALTRYTVVKTAYKAKNK